MATLGVVFGQHRRLSALFTWRLWLGVRQTPPVPQAVPPRKSSAQALAGILIQVLGVPGAVASMACISGRR